MQSKYLSLAAKLRAERPDFYQLFGSRILVEVLPDPELRTAGGLVIAKSSPDRQRTETEENKFCAAIVLSTGRGYYDEETGEDVPLAVKVGQVIEVVRTGLRRYSSHPLLGAEYNTGDIAATKEEAVNGLLANSVEEYADALKLVEQLRAAK